MAIDSKDKRASVFSMFGFCSLFPVADGSISEADRLHVGGLYRGILTIEKPVQVVLAAVLLTVVPSYQAVFIVAGTYIISRVSILTSMECDVVRLTGVRP